MTSRLLKDVLVIDDDHSIRSLVATALTRLKLTCDIAADGGDALDQMDRTSYSVILVDLMMPRIDGAAFVIALREREKASTERPVVLMMTAFSLRDTPMTIGERVQAVIQKPFDVFELAELVRDCVEARAMALLRKEMGAGNVVDLPGDNAGETSEPSEES